MQSFVVLSLDDQAYGLPLSTVERVVRIVEATQLPQAPDIVAGIVNVQGRLLPVVDIRRRLRKPSREALLSDQLIIARTAQRSIALIADAVSGISDYPDEDIIETDDIGPGIGKVSGVVRLADGMILVLDLDRFLSMNDEQALDEVMTQAIAADDSVA